MKQGIHPDFTATPVTCACGNRFDTKSTVEEIHVEICSVCHPFYTGKQRLVDTAGREGRREVITVAGVGLRPTDPGVCTRTPGPELRPYR